MSCELGDLRSQSGENQAAMRRTSILFIVAVASARQASAVGTQHARPLLRIRGGQLNQAAASAATKAAEQALISAASKAAAADSAGWLSILPPVVALGASIALKNVVVALMLGVWAGTAVLARGKPFVALLQVFDTYLVGALADREHAGVLLFTLLLGGTIGIVQRAGGGVGLARLLAGYLTSASRALYAAYALCCLIFFDDYSSVLIVGSSLRPVLPTLALPPERLALVIHTMGVVLAALSPVSSWIGLQLGYVSGVYKQLGLTTDPFVATMRTLPYRFFPLAMAALIPILLVTKRDIGPMADYPLLTDAPPLAASEPEIASLEEPAAAADNQEEVSVEAAADADAADNAADDAAVVRAAGPSATDTSDGPLAPKSGVPHRAINALLPFGTIALATFGGMLIDGAAKLRARDPTAALSLVAILGESDSIAALIWASTLGWLVSSTRTASARTPRLVASRTLDLFRTHAPTRCLAHT